MKPSRSEVVKNNLVLIEQIVSGDVQYREQNRKTLVSRLKKQGIYSEKTVESDIIRSLTKEYKKTYERIQRTI